MKKLYEITYFGNIENVWIKIGHYANNGNLALNLYTESNAPFATITTNIVAFDSKSRACVDINNCPWAQELIEKNYLGIFMAEYVKSGFVEYPVYEFNLDVIEEPAESSRVKI